MQDDLLLNIENLTIEYITDTEIVSAVNGVDLHLRRGQTLGIVGETGAGKTTTALSILRLLPERTGRIVSGSVVFDGVDLLAMTPADMRAIRGSRISMIFQDPMTSLNPVQTVGRQIAEVLELHSADKHARSAINCRVDEILELAGIPAHRKGEYPHQFSGGMKQRVVIAIALACDPELLIADEPTTALDVTIQAQVLDMMTDMKEKLGTSMIMITHDLGVVAAICDMVAVMYAGQIIETGTAEDIFESDVNHPYTTGLFESIPKMGGSEKRLNPIHGMMPDPTDLPSGCVFHPRCPQSMEKCKTIPPADISINGHIIRCHIFTEDQKEVIA